MRVILEVEQVAQSNDSKIEIGFGTGTGWMNAGTGWDYDMIDFPSTCCPCQGPVTANAGIRLFEPIGTLTALDSGHTLVKAP